MPALGVIDDRASRTQEGAPRSLPAAPVLEVRGLTKRFPVRRSWRDILRAPLRAAERVTVVDAVEFSVRPGEFFGLLGANGAGKTTLFRMLATHLLPDAGTATVAGHDVTRAPHEVRACLTSVVTDERSLRWRLTARQNLDLFAALHGLRGAAARARVTEVLRIVDLADDLRMVGGYSSGMKQRLLIARALLSQPRVLLLDEPTRSLDPISARRFRAFLRDEIAIGQRCAVLLATHSADEAFDLCDRVAVLHHGRVLASGPALQLARATLDARFSMLVHRDDVASLRALLERMGREDLHVLGDEIGEPDWVGAELHVPGGAAAGAELLGTLVLHGIRVARMEAVRPTLADMIERIVRDGGGERV